MNCKHCGLVIVPFTSKNRKKEMFIGREWIHFNNKVFCVNASRSREASEKFTNESAEPNKESNVIKILNKIDNGA